MKKKKVMAFCMAFCMTMLLTACGKSGPDNTPAPDPTDNVTEDESGASSQEPIEISFVAAQYSDNTEPYLSALVEKFEKEHSNVKIYLEVVAWTDMAVKWNTMISTGQAPDILNEGSYSAFVDDELLLPADQWLSDELKSNFIPTFYDYNTAQDGTVYAIPLLASVRNLYYNPAIFKEAGIEKVPETWAEVEEACQKIDEKYKGDVYGFGLDFTTNEGQANFCYFIWNNGSDFMENGQWKLNSPKNVEALQWAVDLYNKGYTNPNPATETRDDLQKVFAENKLGMLITANFFPGLYPDMEIGIAPIPHNEGNKSVAMGVQDLLMVFDNDDSEEKLAAISEFMDFFYSDENYTSFMTGESMLPATTSGAEYLAGQDDSYAAYVDILDTAKFYPSSEPLWDDVKAGIRDAMQSALIGDQTAQEALDNLQEQISE